MKYIVLTILLISSLWSADLGWSDDYEKSLKVAKKENKDVYVLITSNSCHWCRKFENSTLQDEEILAMLRKKYVLVHADREMDDLPSWMNVRSVPRHYFVTAKGEEIFSFVGYWDSLDFKSFLGDVDKKRQEKIKKGILK